MLSLLIIIYAALYGITMKVADLLNEHGLKLFRGSNVLFGIVFGLSTVFLILSNVVVANILLAMCIAFLIRGRIDYVNHAIAMTIIIVAFLNYSAFDLPLFLTFYFIFLILGGLKDYVNDKLRKENGLLFILTESMLYYPVPTFIYCLLYGNWIVFYVFLVYTISYNLTKYIGIKKGYK